MTSFSNKSEEASPANPILSSLFPSLISFSFRLIRFTHLRWLVIITLAIGSCLLWNGTTKEMSYVTSTYYSTTTSKEAVAVGAKIDRKPQQYTAESSKNIASRRRELTLETKLAVLRPFSAFDADVLMKTFEAWNEFPPCRVAVFDREFGELGREERKRSPAAHATSVLFLLFSQTFADSPEVVEAVDQVMRIFNEPGGWSECFENIYAVEANIPPELDLYIPSAKDEINNWVNGPNRQFEAAFRIIQSGEWGTFDAFYLMEGDTIPVKALWLDQLYGSIEMNRPFAVLGAKYNGDSWDQFYNEIPYSLLHHFNGNSVYNISHPFLELLVRQLEAEASCPYNSVPFDVRMSQIVVEGQLGIVPKLHHEVGYDVTLSNNTAKFAEWWSTWKHEQPMKETPVIRNYVSTNLIPRHLGPEYVIHGAKLYSPWDPSKTKISLVVSVFSWNQSKPFLETLDSTMHPFSELILMLPPYDTADDFLPKATVPVQLHYRSAPVYMDLCEAPVETEWFMITTSYHHVAHRVDIMFTPGSSKPVIPFTLATYAFCFRFPYCKEDVVLAQRINPGHNKVCYDTHMLYNTRERDAFCQKWKAINGEVGEYLNKEDQHAIGVKREINGPSGPTCTAYAAYLIASGGDTIYKFTDRSMYGARDNFLLDDDPKTCTKYFSEVSCVNAPYECIWRPFFDSCHQPEKPNFSKLQNGVIARTSHQVQPFQPVQMPMLSSVKLTNDAVESLASMPIKAVRPEAQKPGVPVPKPSIPKTATPESKAEAQKPIKPIPKPDVPKPFKRAPQLDAQEPINIALKPDVPKPIKPAPKLDAPNPINPLPKPDAPKQIKPVTKPDAPKPIKPAPKQGVPKPINPEPKPGVPKPIKPAPQLGAQKPINIAPNPINPLPKPDAPKQVKPITKPEALKPINLAPNQGVTKPINPAPKPGVLKPNEPAPQLGAQKPINIAPKPDVPKPIKPAPKLDAPYLINLLPKPDAPKQVKPITKPEALKPNNLAPNQGVPKPINPAPKPGVPEPIKPASQLGAQKPINIAPKPDVPKPIKPSPKLDAPYRINPLPKPDAPKQIKPMTKPDALTPINLAPNQGVPKPINPAPKPGVLKPIKPAPKLGAQKPINIAPKPDVPKTIKPSPKLDAPYLINPLPKPDAPKQVKPITKPEALKPNNLAPNQGVPKPINPAPKPGVPEPIKPAPKLYAPNPINPLPKPDAPEPINPSSKPSQKPSSISTKLKNMLDENARVNTKKLFGINNDTTTLLIELASNFTSVGVYLGNVIFTSQKVMVNITVAVSISQHNSASVTLVMGAISSTRDSVNFIGPVGQIGDRYAWYLIPVSPSIWTAAGIDGRIVSASSEASATSRSVQSKVQGQWVQCVKQCIGDNLSKVFGNTSSLASAMGDLASCTPNCPLDEFFICEDIDKTSRLECLHGCQSGCSKTSWIWDQHKMCKCEAWCYYRYGEGGDLDLSETGLVEEVTSRWKEKFWTELQNYTCSGGSAGKIFVITDWPPLWNCDWWIGGFNLYLTEVVKVGPHNYKVKLYMHDYFHQPFDLHKWHISNKKEWPGSKPYNVSYTWTESITCEAQPSKPPSLVPTPVPQPKCINPVYCNGSP